MILQALNGYYERVAAEPDTGIAPFGFSRQKIAFRVVLNADGTLHGIEDHRVERNGKDVARLVLVCGDAKPPGQGINPCFLWDNAAYMLGWKPDDEKPERTRECFETFRQHHLDLEEAVDDPAFTAVCRFLEAWDPDTADEHGTLAEVGPGFGVFTLRAEEGHIHDRTRIVEFWRERTTAPADEAGDTAQCLVTGEVGPVARLHEPKIKGVAGAQSAGALLVSYNCDAFESYGHDQGDNAPVGERIAFQYCTALNHLLRDEHRRFRIGDTTTVFWTERPTPAENVLGLAFNTPVGVEDTDRVNELKGILGSIGQGAQPAALDDGGTPFFVLGLAPNAARLSVRFWHVSTLSEIVDRVRRHFEDLHLDRTERDPEFPAVWQLLRETARESKDVPPLLGGALMRAILTGQPYPSALYTAVLRRIRADRTVNHVRAAILKACLTRQHPELELPVSLDPDRPEPAYHMGRLFAVLEKAQEDALPGLNATIKDRYFSSVSATPAGVFPRLIRMNQHHMAKLDTGPRIHRERSKQEIADRIDGFPNHLGLTDQGLFALGYYHQRRDLFTKKSDAPTPETTED